MIIGLVLALIQAILPPFVWLVMGDFVSLSIIREVRPFSAIISDFNNFRFQIE